MDFTDVLARRRSIRDFSTQPVEKATIEKIVTQAAQSASWANSQPWKAYVATVATLAKVKADHLARSKRGERGQTDLAISHRTSWRPAAQANMAEWGQGIQALAGMEYIESQGKLFNAAALVYLTLPKNFSGWSLYDLGAFGQALMLAATNAGVDSIPAYEIVKYPAAVRQLVGIPEDEAVVMGIALGYRSAARVNDFQSTRQPLDAVLTVRD